MKLSNKVIKFAVLPILVLLVVLWGLTSFLSGAIVKAGVESAATKSLGVVVNIDDIDISILKSDLEINGLIVNNPPGYTNKNLLELNQGYVKTSIASLLDDTVRIKKFKLDGINLVIEQKALSNNLHDIIKSLPTKDKQESETETAGKKLHIDDLEITNIKVKVKLLPIPGKRDMVDINLEPIRMSNLGSDNKLSTGVLVSKILVAIAEGVAKKGAGILPKEMIKTMKNTLDEAVGLGITLTQEGGKLIDKGKDVGTEIIEGFQGLLKPKKKE